jgi:hypothetical protein
MLILNNIPPCKDWHRLWNNGAILVGPGTMLWSDGVSAAPTGISTWRSGANLKLQERLVMQVFALPCSQPNSPITSPICFPTLFILNLAFLILRWPYSVHLSNLIHGGRQP